MRENLSNGILGRESLSQQPTTVLPHGGSQFRIIGQTQRITKKTLVISIQAAQPRSMVLKHPEQIIARFDAGQYGKPPIKIAKQFTGNVLSLQSCIQRN